MEGARLCCQRASVPPPHGRRVRAQALFEALWKHSPSSATILAQPGPSRDIDLEKSFILCHKSGIGDDSVMCNAANHRCFIRPASFASSSVA